MQERRQHTNNPFDIPEFREEFKQSLADTITPITTLVTAHENKLKEHDAIINRQRGALWAIGLAWTVFVGGIEALLHIKKAGAP